MKKIILAALALFVLPATVQADHHNEAAKKNIVETAVAAKFNTLVAAVKAGGLVETLSGEGPFTVFAPTDEAFEKLPEGTLQSLLKPENKDQLVAILKYHVVAGKVPAKTVVTLDSAKTLGGEVSIEVQDGTVMLNDKVKVVKTDVMASNGIIHVIDSVLLPPSK
ncbi:beta-Ig-H3/fasciclin [Rhodopirellula islandica]|uniref:Beta-Ig-H3/fasciclin n=1 Tax=Rhodopirellula islandica TaxID=595434 RepID=A0A0J1BH47_RHOIS|nr:fasciclin domain-containing protein [Rhodopirellula islandica]KLU05861.1 beta-Ig-H3/fasciclin [Rhodopirellula islandica]